MTLPLLDDHRASAAATDVCGVLACVVAARGCVGDAAAVVERDDGAVGAEGLGEVVTALAALESAATALRLRLAARQEAARAAAAALQPDVGSWLSSLTGNRREAEAGGLRLARQLETRCHHTRDAFAEGRLSLAQVRVIAFAVEHAPPGIADADLAEAEALLVAKATGDALPSGRPLSPGRLRAAARRMFDRLGAAVAEQHGNEVLVAQEDFAASRTYLQLGDNGDGTWSGRFLVPEAHGRLLASFLQQLSSPRRLSRDRAGELVVDDTAPTGGSIGLGYDELLGHALCETIEHLPTDGWQGRNGLTMIVTTTLDALRGSLAAAGLETGAHTGAAWSAGQVRRAACEAAILPAVLGGESLPLDVGRTRRLHTAAQRAALRLLHDTCGVAGCSRPFSWCEIHHPHPWGQGGGTTLDNALPLCAWHHQRAHEGRWDLRHHDGGGWRFHRRR